MESIINNDLIDVFLNNDIEYVVSVPCSIMASYYSFTNKDNLDNIIVTREEEGVGIVSGLSLANKKSVLLMQNSGLGNCINALASLSIPYKLGYIVIITLRGDDIYEKNPVQNTLGKATRGILTSLECKYLEVNKSNNFNITFSKALDLLEEYSEPIFILLPRKELLV